MNTSRVTPQLGDDEPLVLVRRDRALLRITLNRPRALNALNHEMVTTLLEVLRSERERIAAGTVETAAVMLDGVGERGFCGGGDVKELTRSSPTEQLGFLRTEYTLDATIAEYPVPVISVMHGVTMGGGIGIGGHGAIRVVTESAKLAMPEVRIGILPDVGGLLLLANAPGTLGEMLALTAGVMRAGDAVALGFADAVVPSERVADLRELVARGVSPRLAVTQLQMHPPESPLTNARAWWQGLAEEALGGAELVAENPVVATLRLVGALEESPHHEARDLAALVRHMCPVAVVVSLAQLSRIRQLGLGLREVLAEDYRLMGRLMARPDFAEGVRAQLVDRDGAPRWQPAHLDEVSVDEVRALLDVTPLPGELPLWD